MPFFLMDVPCLLSLSLPSPIWSWWKGLETNLYKKSLFFLFCKPLSSASVAIN